MFCEPDDWTRRWSELASDLLIASWEEVLANAHLEIGGTAFGAKHGTSNRAFGLNELAHAHQGRLESCGQEFVATMGFQGARVLARKSY